MLVDQLGRSRTMAGVGVAFLLLSGLPAFAGFYAINTADPDSAEVAVANATVSGLALAALLTVAGEMFLKAVEWLADEPQGRDRSLYALGLVFLFAGIGLLFAMGFTAVVNQWPPFAEAKFALANGTLAGLGMVGSSSNVGKAFIKHIEYRHDRGGPPAP